MDPLKESLRTLNGQLILFGLTTVGALGFAIFLTTQTPFFQSYVWEKPPSTDAVALKQVESNVEKLKGKETVALTDVQRESVYRLWMDGTDEMQPDAHTVQRLAAIAPEWFDERIERTLVAGNVEQRKKAVDYAVKSNREGMKARLEWGLDRARRVGPPGADKVIEDGLRLLR